MSEQQGMNAWQWNDPAQEEARQARHALLIDLLGAYVDEELPPETASQLDAHLVGCARCRREVQLQLRLRDALAGTPVEPARPALRDRILAATQTLPPAPDATPAVAPPSARSWFRMRWLVAGLALAGALAGGLATGRSFRERSSAAVATLAAEPSTVPLLSAIVADYRRLGGADLPGPARDLESVRAAVGVPVEPLTSPSLRLIGAWTTTIDGDPTAVLAYRWDDRVIVQYIVPDQLFFRHPALRAAAATHHAVGAASGSTGIVAWPVRAAGSVLVGDGTPKRLAEALAR